MFTTRLLAVFASLSLSACAMELGENGQALQFSDQPGVNTAADLANARTGSDLLARLADPATSTHNYGDPVAYGAIEAVCNAPRTLGTKIASDGGFAIYDSNPGSTAQRAHYVTGFADRCARQFSAALVLTGDVGTHEVLRYLPSNRATYNGTDTAYEMLKARYCRVGQGKPCGRRLDALAGETTFITAYETFGSRARWVEILLHDGEMTEIDFKTN